MTRPLLCFVVAAALVAVFHQPLRAASLTADDLVQRPFGDAFPNLDGWATGAWWEAPAARSAKIMNVAPGLRESPITTRKQIAEAQCQPATSGDLKSPQCKIVMPPLSG